jgi:hypothetical protein
MNMNQNIPLPITFNPQKHHFGYLLKKKAQWQEQDWTATESELLFIGNNLLDLYLGRLSVEDICHECLQFFEKERITSPASLSKWLHPLAYRKIVLSDKSCWIIKKGLDHKRYIHIHPAKNAPFTIRVRGTTLKTVLALKIHQKKLTGKQEKNLQTVNQIRTRYLGLSPVKSLTHGKGISRLWALFSPPTKQT